MLYLCIGAGIGLLALLFKAASALRLGVPLLYALIVPTVFHGWFYAHYDLAYWIWYTLLGLVVLSWVVTIVSKVRDLVF